MIPGTAPVSMSEETIADRIARVAGMRLAWLEETFGAKIEPIEDEK